MALIRAYLARDGADAQLVCGVLQAEGIAAVVMGEHLQALGGAIPFSAAQPVVCVDEQDVGRAAKVIAGIAERSAHRKPAGRPSLWRCQTCGEMHEPQFSECWNCLTLRGDDSADAPALPTASLAELTMERGLPCTYCGYDLRGLPADHGCPECGYPVVGSVLDTLAQANPTDPDSLDRLIRGPFEAAARGTGFPVDALLVICHAWLRALMPMDRRMPGEMVDAAELCFFVREYAIRQFGGRNEARKLFKRWGIVSGEQIARIGAGLLAAGLLPASTPVDPTALEGGLSLNDLFPADR